MAEVLTRERLETIVKDTFAHQLKRPPDQVALSASIRKDLGIDSLDIVELMFELEKRFEIVIPDSDLFQITTIADLLDYLAKKLNVSSEPPHA